MSQKYTTRMGNNSNENDETSRLIDLNEGTSNSSSNDCTTAASVINFNMMTIVPLATLSQNQKIFLGLFSVFFFAQIVMFFDFDIYQSYYAMKTRFSGILSNGIIPIPGKSGNTELDISEPGISEKISRIESQNFELYDAELRLRSFNDYFDEASLKKR